MTTTEERRREVLALAREHNFLILEGECQSLLSTQSLPTKVPLCLDDPYYYLYFGKAARPRSYFTLECELPEVGRVIRFDSVSKILSSGIRIGFVCAPEPILTKIDMHVHTPAFYSSP